MADVPAYCEKCKLAFAVANVFGADIGDLYMTGNVTECPKCHGTARFIDGHFKVAGNSMEFISGPNASRVLLDRLKRVVEQAREKQTDAVELLAEIADVSPQLANKLKSKHNLSVVMMMLVIIWLIKSVELNVKIDMNKLIDEAYHVSQGQDPEAHLNLNPATFSLPQSVVAKPSRQSATGVAQRLKKETQAESRRIASLERRHAKQVSQPVKPYPS